MGTTVRTHEGTEPVSPPSAGRQLWQNSAFYGATNFGVKAASFLLVTLYTRYLAPSDYGIISLAEIFAIAIATLCSLGLDAALWRLYFQFVDEPRTLRLVVSSVLRFALLMTVIVVGLTFLVGPLLLRILLPHFEVRFYPFIALAIGTAALNQLCDYQSGIYLAQQKPRAFARLMFSFFALTAIGVILGVVILHRGATGYLAGKFFAACAATLLVAMLARHWITGGWAWRYVRSTLPLALPIVPHLFLALGLVVADRFILEHYRGLYEVGIYSMAYTFGMVMFLVSNSLQQAWTSLFYDLARTGSQLVIARLLTGMTVGLTAIAIFGSLIAPGFVSVFLDHRYHAAGRIVPIVIGGYLFHAFFGIFQAFAFQAKRTNVIWVLSLTAFVFNIALNLAWVPRWGLYGAAYATLIAYAIEMGLMYVYAMRVFPLPSRLGELTVCFGAFAIALVISQAPWSPTNKSLAMLAGTIACGWMLWRIGGNNVREILNQLRR